MIRMRPGLDAVYVEHERGPNQLQAFSTFHEIHGPRVRRIGPRLQGSADDTAPRCRHAALELRDLSPEEHLAEWPILVDNTGHSEHMDGVVDVD